MELRQLECVVAVAEHQHFGRAAASLSMGQPGLSQQIRRLERELGVTLFERSSRRVALTAAGERFVPLARDVLAAAEWARDVQPSGESAVRVAVCSGLGFALAEALESVRRRRPDVAMVTVQQPEDAAVAGLRAGSLDAVIVRQARGDDLVGTVVGRERLWVAALESVFKGRRRGVAAGDLADVPARLLTDDPDPALLAAAGVRAPGNPASLDQVLADWAVGEQSWLGLHPLQAAAIARLRLPRVTVRPLDPAVSGTLTMLTTVPPVGVLAHLADELGTALRQAGSGA